MNHEKPNPSVERTSETQARRLRYVKQHPQVALPIRISYQRSPMTGRFRSRSYSARESGTSIPRRDAMKFCAGA